MNNLINIITINFFIKLLYNTFIHLFSILIENKQLIMISLINEYLKQIKTFIFIIKNYYAKIKIH